MKNRVKDLVDGALSGQVAFHLFMMLGTGIGANIASYPELLNLGLSPLTASYVAAAIGVLAAMSVDGFFKRGLPYAVSVLAGKKDRATGVERRKGFNIVVVALVALTGFVSIYLNFSITPEISSGIVKGPDDTQRDARIAAAVNKSDRDITRLEEIAESARKDLQDAKNNRAAAITAAENHYGKAEGDRYRNNNSYSLKILRPFVDKAKRQHDKLVAAAQDKADKAEVSLSAFLASSAADLKAEKNRIESEYSKGEEKADQSKSRWTYAFFLLWIVSFGGFIGCTAVVVMYEDETGEDVTHNPTILSVTWKSLVRIKDVSLAFFIRQAGLQESFAMPVLAGRATTYDLPPTLEERPKIKPERLSDRTEKKDRKSDCKTEKCAPKSERLKKSEEISESDSGRTERSGEWSGDEVGESDHWEHKGYDLPSAPPYPGGGEWPHPSDYNEWKGFTKRLREWYKQAYIAETEPTRERNRQRVIASIAYIRKDLNGVISFNSDALKLSIKV